ncbi:MAG: hypothetical protein AB1414_08310 [bacterium]
MKDFCKFLIICFIIFSATKAMAGIPLEKQITPDEAKARYEVMKRQKEQMARDLLEEKQKKEEQQQIQKLIQLPPPSAPKEEKLPKKITQGEELKEEKAILTPAQQEAKGIVPGAVPTEKETEEIKKIEKQEKIAQEFKNKRNISIILVIIVMITTIVLLFRSMYKGKPKDGKKEE